MPPKKKTPATTTASKKRVVKTPTVKKTPTACIMPSVKSTPVAVRGKCTTTNERSEQPFHFHFRIMMITPRCYKLTHHHATLFCFDEIMLVLVIINLLFSRRGHTAEEEESGPQIAPVTQQVGKFKAKWSTAAANSS
jgi:hypothetical protein